MSNLKACCSGEALCHGRVNNNRGGHCVQCAKLGRLLIGGLCENISCENISCESISFENISISYSECIFLHSETCNQLHIYFSALSLHLVMTTIIL
jgi:hypothetical protein